MKILKAIKNILLYLWQLPQNAIGLVYLVYNKLRRKIVENDKSVPNVFFYVLKDMAGAGVSLGKYVFLHKDYLDEFLMRHEHGHIKQSLILGPLYLFVIGLPSLVWASLYTFLWMRGMRKPYHWFYTEKWANRLGGVKN